MMESDKKKEFSEKQRDEFEKSLRRHFRVQCLVISLPVVAHLTLLVVSLSWFDAYWPITVVAMFIGAGIGWSNQWTHNRCPACDRWVFRRPPNRGRKFCPSCGSQVFN